MPCSLAGAGGHGTVRPMRDLFILAIHLLVNLVKLFRPGGVRAIVAESLLLKHQLLISNRSRHRAPNLTTLDRVVLGLTTLVVNPRRIARLCTLEESGLGAGPAGTKVYHIMAGHGNRNRPRSTDTGKSSVWTKIGCPLPLSLQH